MPVKFTRRQKIVSLFIICGVILFFVSLVSIGRGKNFFGKKYYYFTTFKSGEGLQKGMTVYMNGFPIGNLENMVLDYKNNVILKIGVYEKHWKRIKDGSIIRLISPLFGSKTLEIIPGEFSAPLLKNFSKIASYDSEEGRKILYARRDEIPTPPIDAIIINTSEIMKKINDPQGPFFANLENFRVISKNVGKISDKIMNNQERIDNIFKHMEESTANMETISKSIMNSPYFEKKETKPKKSSINLNESYSPYNTK
ncbi:MAG: MCE family protein [Elusimicrobia bacterium]|nr:MCE family protein [Elusimicrobiota bacterium]